MIIESHIGLGVFQKMALRSFSECPTSPKTTEQIEYIRQLEHRNRMKKSVAAKSTRRLQEMEQGFALHFGGANSKKKRQSDPGTTVVARRAAGRRRTWGGRRPSSQSESDSVMSKLVAAAEKLDEASQRLLVDVATTDRETLAEIRQLLCLKNEREERKILTIRIHDGWDVARVAGLDAIELVGLETEINPCDLQLFAGSPPRPAPLTSRSAAELPHLLDSTQSWIVRLPSDGPVEVQVALPLEFRPDGNILCRITNCSAVIGERLVGTRRLDLVLDGQQIWSGVLARFCGESEARNDILEIQLLAATDTGEETAAIVAPAPAPEEITSGPTKEIASVVRNLFPVTSCTDNLLVLGKKEANHADIAQTELISDGVADEKCHVEGNAAPQHAALPVWLSDGKNAARRPLAVPVPPTQSNVSSSSGRMESDAVPTETMAVGKEAADGESKNSSSSARMKSSARRRRTHMEAPAPVVENEVVRAEEPPPERVNQWSQVKALKCEDALSPLSQLAYLSEVQQHQSQAAPPSQGRKKNESLQESWDSLTYFSKKSKSRLAQAGASILDFPLSNSPGEKGTVEQDISPLYETASFASQSLAESMVMDKTYPAPQPACEDNIVQIPTLPRGRILRLEILSTWGDPYYVGLHGIEVFDEDGVEIKPISIAATPPSINVLPEYDSDPRTAEKLVDGVYCTCDELHAWLAPYEAGTQEHSIILELSEIVDPSPTLSMLRIWNYNKSRAHSYRGARRVRASLDGTPIFDGEIRKAPGMLENAASASEMILFTVSEDLISKIEKNDKASGGEDKIDATLLRQAAHQLTQARPKTSEEVVLHRVALDSSTLSYSDMLVQEGLSRQEGRPLTSTTTRPEATTNLKKVERLFPVDEEIIKTSVPSTSDELLQLTSDHPEETSITIDEPVSKTTISEANRILARRITFRILSTWGDRHYVGLSGFTVFGDAAGTAIDVAPSQLSADPRDLVSLGHLGDPRTLDKLVDGKTQTSDDRHFWLVPFSQQKHPWVSFDLGSKIPIWGVGLCNYNKSPEDALRGARLVQVEIDGVCRGTIELRPAPGRARVNYEQRFSFAEITDKKTSSPPSSVCHVVASRFDDSSIFLDDYETPELPRGSLLRLVLHGTCGDPYYVGLDRLEIRDADNKLVEPESVGGSPDSIRILGDDFKLDSREPQNLLKGNLSSSSWLAPTRISMPDSEFPGYPEENELYICLSKPVLLSEMTVWNYSKTPARGAREVSLWIDGHLVARARLVRADEACCAPQRLLFGPERFKQARRQKRPLPCQDVLCIDENQVRIRSKAMFDTDVCAEGVFSSQLNHLDRPVTAAAIG